MWCFKTVISLGPLNFPQPFSQLSHMSKPPHQTRPTNTKSEVGNGFYIVISTYFILNGKIIKPKQ